MVRGRSVNVALPETRELIRQREYRARKAARISELENENARLREQNQRLLQELESMKQSGSGDSKSQMDGVKMQGIVVDEVKEQLYLALAKLHSISSSGRPCAPPPPRHYDQQPCGSTSTPTRWPEDDRKIPTAPAPVSLAPSHSDTPLAHLAEAASCCMGVVDCNPPITPMSNIAASTNPDQIQPSQPTFPTRHEFDAAEALRLSTRTIDETKCCLGLIDCDDM